MFATCNAYAVVASWSIIKKRMKSIKPLSYDKIDKQTRGEMNQMIRERENIDPTGFARPRIDGKHTMRPKRKKSQRPAPSFSIAARIRGPGARSISSRLPRFALSTPLLFLSGGPTRRKIGSGHSAGSILLPNCQTTFRLRVIIDGRVQ